MYVKKDLDFRNLEDNCWCCDDVLEKIADANMEDALMDLLEEVFFSEVPTMTEVNDFIRFDYEYIYENLGISDDDEEDDGNDDNGPLELTQTKEVTDADTITYGPFLQVRWGQNWPYNKYCYTTDGQKAPSGCVATAIAQIMSYYKHPSSIIVDYEGHPQTLHLDWDAMNNHVYSFIPANYPSSCPCTYPYTEVHNKIGHVFRQIGKYVNMIYSIDGSDANSANVATALANLGYAYGTYRDYNSSVVISSIMNSQIVYMRGVDTNENEGHAWVIDGYKNIYGTTTVYVKPNSQLTWEILEQNTFSDKFYHINWGWDGDCNGYFTSGIFNTQLETTYDSGVSHKYDYNYVQSLKIYPNIRKKL